MATKLEKKLKTRRALMDSALSLVADGHHYSSLSLRVVSKRAGVVPNAFYRHFSGLDELGLSLTDEIGLLLRQLMRNARLNGLAAHSMIADSVDFYMNNVRQSPALFRFMAQSLSGGSPAMREAIRLELGYFAKEMVMDLNRLRIFNDMEAIDLDMLGHLVINTVSSVTTELLDLPENSENLVAGIRDRTIKQVRLIFLGAGYWNSHQKKKKKKKKSK